MFCFIDNVGMMLSVAAQMVPVYTYALFSHTTFFKENYFVDL